MKNKLTFLLLFIGFLLHGQLTETKVIDFVGPTTTAERDSWDVPANKMRLIYNTDTQQLELGDENEVWVAVGSGGGGSDGVISNVALNTLSLDFTGTNGGFNGSIDLTPVQDGTESTTVSDTPEIDLTLTGDDITADIVSGSIDESKLDASTNASLDLADSALQSEVDGSVTNEIQDLEQVLTEDNDANFQFITDLSSLDIGEPTDTDRFVRHIINNDDEYWIAPDAGVGGFIDILSYDFDTQEWLIDGNRITTTADSGGSDGVVSNVALNGTNLDFTGSGGGFNGSVALSSLQDGTGTDDQNASEVPFTPYLTITSSDTQAAVQELKDEVDGIAGGAESTTVSDTSEIDLTLTGSDITADIVTGSIDETKLDASTNASLDLADSALQNGDNISGLTNDSGYITSQSDDQNAGEVPFSPTGNTTSTDVQAAIEEIQTELDGVSGGGITTYRKHRILDKTADFTFSQDDQSATSGSFENQSALVTVQTAVTVTGTLPNRSANVDENYFLNVTNSGGQINVVPDSGVTISGDGSGANTAFNIDGIGSADCFELTDGNFWCDGNNLTWYTPDTTAPLVSSAMVEDADPDALVVVFDEPVNVTNVTGLTLDGDWTSVNFSSIQSGNGTATVTFDLDTDIANGETGNFVYSGSNTISDLSGNALASGSTSVTNNVAGASNLFTAISETNPDSPSDASITSDSVGDEEWQNEGDSYFNVTHDVGDVPSGATTTESVRYERDESGFQFGNRHLHISALNTFITGYDAATTYTLTFWVKVNYISGPQGFEITMTNTDVLTSNLGSVSGDVITHTLTNNTWTEFVITFSGNGSDIELNVDPAENTLTNWEMNIAETTITE